MEFPVELLLLPCCEVEDDVDVDNDVKEPFLLWLPLLLFEFPSVREKSTGSVRDFRKNSFYCLEIVLKKFVKLLQTNLIIKV